MTTDDTERALAIGAAVWAHGCAAELLSGGSAEVTLVWTERGLKHKARLDWRSDANHAIVDLKTARDVGERGFGRSAASLGYDIQAAHYRAGWNALHGVVPDWVWIAVESAPPHDVAVWHADSDVLDNAAFTRETLLDRYKLARKTGDWPGQCPEATTLSWPRWALPDEDWDVTTEAA